MFPPAADPGFVELAEAVPLEFPEEEPTTWLARRATSKYFPDLNFLYIALREELFIDFIRLSNTLKQGERLSKV